MRKYQWIVAIVALIGCMVSFTSCEQGKKMMEPLLPDAEPEVETVEPVIPDTQTGDTSMLTNSLIIADATVVNAPLPEPANSPTAPQIEGNLPEVTAAAGSIILLPFEYSGTNTLAGCIVYIPGVAAYYEIPYTGGPDDLPSVIPVSLSENVSTGSFIQLCYGVYDNQGQTSNFLNTVVTVETEMVEPSVEMPVGPADVLIYTNRSFWITLEDAAMAAETTKSLLDSAGIQVEITKDDAYVRNWMLQTTGDGNVNVIVLYGVLPASIYGTGNIQPDGSIAENWIETTDGDTILNHADYIAYNTDYDVDKLAGLTPAEKAGRAVGSNQEGGLQNLMDNPNIVMGVSRGRQANLMIVTSDGNALTPSLVNFETWRSIPLNQLQGEWFAEKVFASDTGNAEATYADPVIVRDGNRGRLAVVHATFMSEGLLNGEVAAEIISNYLLAE